MPFVKLSFVEANIGRNCGYFKSLQLFGRWEVIYILKCYLHLDMNLCLLINVHDLALINETDRPTTNLSTFVEQPDGLRRNRIKMASNDTNKFKHNIYKKKSTYMQTHTHTQQKYIHMPVNVTVVLEVELQCLKYL